MAALVVDLKINKDQGESGLNRAGTFISRTVSNAAI